MTIVALILFTFQELELLLNKSYIQMDGHHFKKIDDLKNKSSIQRKILWKRNNSWEHLS